MSNTVTVIKGDTWRRAWAIFYENTDRFVDFTDAAMRLQIRDKAKVLKAEASLDNGRLVVAISTGRIDMVMPAAVMATLISGTHYTFGLEVTFSTGIVTTYETGVLSIYKDPVS